MRTLAFDGELTPAGSQGSGFLPISRRTFLAALAASPALAAVPVPKLALQPAGDAPFLTFSEDSQGLTVTMHHKWRSSLDWRLPRRAFGHNAGFLLRTLTGGTQAGYEVLVYHVQFGRLHDQRYLIMFRPVGDGWDVSMRTDLWTSSHAPPPNQPERGPSAKSMELALPVELTSTRVPFENLVASGGRLACCWRPALLRFDTDSGAINAAIQDLFEGHVAARGKVALEFDADCVWTLRAKSGRIGAFDDEFELQNLELAWCEPLGAASSDKVASGGGSACADGVTIAQARNRASATTARASLADPVFCASARSPTRPKTVVGSPSEELNLRCAWQASTEVTFTFSRQDWVSPKGAVIRGIATIRGAMHADVLARQKTRFGNLRLPLVTERRQVVVDKGQTRLERTLEGRIDSASHQVESPIGRLVIRGRWVEDSTKKVAAKDSGVECATDAEKMFVAAYVREAGTHAPRSADRLRSIEINVLLLESELAPADADHSSLQFFDAEVRAFYRAGTTNDPAAWRSSYVWLGEDKELQHPQTTDPSYRRPLAIIDLSLARLEVSRYKALLRLAFMFADMNLEVGPKDVRITRRTPECRVLSRGRVAWRERWRSDAQPKARAQEPDLDDGPILDSRPTLVVEFPPQHLLEEAVFRPNGPDLPDVTLKESRFQMDARELSTNARGLVAQITPLGIEDRAKIRRKYAELKVSTEDAAGRNDFATFAKAFEERCPATFPADQKIYIGPYGMDADAAAVARRQALETLRTRVATTFDNTLREINEVLIRLNADKDPNPDPNPRVARLFKFAKGILTDLLHGASAPGQAVNRAVALEAALASVSADYTFFREYYRSEMTRLVVLAADDPGVASYKDLVVELRPKTLEVKEIDYFSPDNRSAMAIDDNAANERAKLVKKQYVDVLLGRDELPEVTRARLANPSRLAFRVDCDPANGKSLANPNRAPSHIAFTVAGLTDWSSYELAVVPRAYAIGGDDLAEDSASDEKPPSNTDTARMLTHLGFKSGRYVTAQERIADIAASLRAPPGPLETSIEIPARLTLSPSQRAAWRTPSGLVEQVFDGLAKQRTKDGKPSARKKRGSRVLLWTADLRIKDPEPGLRAVHSPDLRAGFVHSGVERAVWRFKADKKILRTAGASAPPRGSRAPWTLGIEEGDAQATSLGDVYEKFKLPGAGSLEDSCKVATTRKEEGKSTGESSNFHPLFKYLCEQRNTLSWLRQHPKELLFRTSLDAYDRHELVVLSSAWGLPVRGRRGVDLEISPFGTSSQVEAPERFRPIDIESTAALYNPRALRVQELRLSALGGTFRHDTSFVPPAAALHIGYDALFDAFSIERWQQWVVLGRDVFAEVVYKGYLFPIGHRASLIKQTERVFLRRKIATANGGTVDEGVRAFLRQRMFIRIGQPNKSFPAVGHPNDGRQFPADTVRILTVNSPDIVDPAQDMFREGLSSEQTEGPAPGGRLFLDWPGLVFWPRTARLDGFDVRFDVQIDNVFTSTPMIFVDNVAAHTSDLLPKIIDYYNRRLDTPDDPVTGVMSTVDPIAHKRTIEFGEQTQRYCDESRPGACSHKTSYWTLRALGGVYTGPRKNDPDYSADWEGTNTYFTDPLLEGADQPPFYPAVETARIRVDQVERFAGNTNTPVLVQFDGFYVANGFFVPPVNEVSQGGSTQPVDKLEIYLDILSPLVMSMGPSGDRSGGVYRPESLLVALCRTRGPLSGQSRSAARKTADRSALFTRVKDYIDAQPQTATPASNKPPEAPASYTQYFQPANVGAGTKSILATKLFGLVEISELVKYCSMASAEKGLPMLQEAVQYGTSLADESSEAIRTRVVVPLAKIVDQLQKKWQDLDKKIPQSEYGRIQLQDVFPDVYAALAALQGALRTSAGSAQGAQFFASLAGIYEAGNRLVDALDRASNSLPERVRGVALSKLGAPFETVKSGPVRWLQTLKDLWTAANQGNQLAILLANTMTAAQADLAKFFPFPYAGFAPGSEKANFAETTIVIPVAALQDAARKSIVDTLGGKDADAAARDLLVALVGAADARARLATDGLDAVKEDAIKDFFFDYKAEEQKTIQTLREYQRRIAGWKSRLPSSIPEELMPLYTMQSLVLAAVASLARGFGKVSVDSLGALGTAVSKFIEAFTVDVVKDEALTAINLLAAIKQLKGNLEEAATQLGAKSAKEFKACADANADTFETVAIPGSSFFVNTVTEALVNFVHDVRTALKDQDLEDPTAKNVLRAAGLDALRYACTLSAIAARLNDLLKPLVVDNLPKLNTHQLVQACEYRGIVLEQLGDAVKRIFAQPLPPGVTLPDGVDQTLGRSMWVFLREATALAQRVVNFYSDVSDRWSALVSAIAKLDFVPRRIRASATTFGDAMAAAKLQLAAAQAQVKGASNSKWSALITSDARQSVEALFGKLSWDAVGPWGGHASVDAVVGEVAEYWRQRALTAETEAARVFSRHIARLIGSEKGTDKGSLIDLYQQSKDLRRKAYDALPEQMEALRALLLVKVDKPVFKVTPTSPLTPDSDQLYYDWSSLIEVAKWSAGGFILEREPRVLSEDPREFIVQLLRGWERGEASPIRVLNQAMRFAIDAAREQLRRLVDFSSFREAIDHEIRQLLPVSTSVSYDYNLKLTESAKKATGGVFCPKKDCSLDIHSNASVNFLTRKASFLANGEIGPFDIHLVGDSFDAVTLFFNGATFRSVDGGALKCDVQYKDFKIGQQLKFLQDLAAFFGPKQGSGFYLQLLSGGLGLEAGYGLNIGTISIGTISFFNISLNAAVRLRFDGEASTFVASLSRRDSPFTISVAPYGGSGFFAIEADAKGIVGFEASFEYGGAAAFAYGPLQGQGRLMMGVYVRRKRSKTDIWGTFYIGGSAAIWIFTFGASLYVCASMQDSKMVGDATFTFSFSMGLCDFSYSVQMHYEQQWSGGSKSADAGSSAMDEPIVLAQSEYGRDGLVTLSDAGPAYRRSLRTTSARQSPAQPDHKQARIRADTYCQGEDWGRFRNYFDFGLQIDTGFDA